MVWLAQNLEEMDSSMLNKLCRDCKLMGRGLTTTQVELTFASVKLKGRRRINFEQFTDALSLFAEKRGQDLRAIVDLILSSHGPQAKGTQPDFVKFHDDKVGCPHLLHPLLPFHCCPFSTTMPSPKPLCKAA